MPWQKGKEDSLHWEENSPNLKKKGAKEKINFDNGLTYKKNGYSNKENYYNGKLNQYGKWTSSRV